MEQLFIISGTIYFTLSLLIFAGYVIEKSSKRSRRLEKRIEEVNNRIDELYQMIDELYQLNETIKRQENDLGINN